MDEWTLCEIEKIVARDGRLDSDSLARTMIATIRYLKTRVAELERNEAAAKELAAASNPCCDSQNDNVEGHVLRDLPNRGGGQ